MPIHLLQATSLYNLFNYFYLPIKLCLCHSSSILHKNFLIFFALARFLMLHLNFFILYFSLPLPQLDFFHCEFLHLILLHLVHLKLNCSSWVTLLLFFFFAICWPIGHERVSESPSVSGLVAEVCAPDSEVLVSCQRDDQILGSSFFLLYYNLPRVLVLEGLVFVCIFSHIMWSR